MSKILPNFLVIGAQKSGTTSLCYLIGKHPDIFICEPKEPHFFAKDEVYQRGLEWYSALFHRATNVRAVGEGSTGYTMHTVFPLAPTRIARDLPGAKLIYMVRDPLERIESAWMQRRGDGLPTWSLGKTLKRYSRMVDASCYWRQLNYYRKNFADEKILVLFFEDFKRDPENVLRTCYEFLNVDSEVVVDNLDKIENQSLGKLGGSALSVWARHNPNIRRAADFFPQSWRHTARDFWPRKLTKRPEWDASSLEWVLYEVAPDAAEILNYAGKPGDYWDLGLHRMGQR